MLSNSIRPPPPEKSAFFANHQTLDDGIEVVALGRGFSVYGIDLAYGYEAAATDLDSDGVVNRCVPVYVLLADSSDFCVTDLIDVRFDGDLPGDSAKALLAAHGLVFVDSNSFSHNLWQAALHDTIKTSPLGYANDLREEDAVIWAAPATYSRVCLHSEPSDPYFPNQYYLKHTGQFGGVTDTDIDADSAWMFALADSAILVAIIDDGFEDHPDLSSSRWVAPQDFRINMVGDIPIVVRDNDPTPEDTTDNHGMACAGVLAASHNGEGIAGLAGSCEIVPIRAPMTTNWTEDGARAGAIRYAHEVGAKVISCSWGYDSPIPRTVVEEAIQEVSDVCSTAPDEHGSVVVVSVGNSGWGVEFPANMDETIGVGGISKQNVHWTWSCTGPEVDVVAVTGPLYLVGDIWTIDRVGNRGWNPLATGEPLANRDYTARFGGTSAACPQVAGLIALVAAKRPDLMNDCRPLDAMRDILCQSAEYLYDPGEEDEFGCGRANAFRALLAVSRGELSNDGVYNPLDVVLTVNQAFRGAGPQGLHPGHADINCDGVISVLDVVGVVNVAYRSASLPEPCYRYDGYTTEPK